METKTPPAPVFGLVLAGGASRRMKHDKALLDYHGKPQLVWTYELLSRVCERVFVSVREDQSEEPIRSGLPQIVDSETGLGPAGGILSAQKAHPTAAWLVVACDLPYLDEETFRSLLNRRDPSQHATAFRSTHDGLPEPLCAIWEPSSNQALADFVRSGVNCPRKFLINSATKLLEQDSSNALDNINTPDERRSARQEFALNQ